MKNTKRKILSIILAMVMVLGVIPFAGLSAFAYGGHTHKDSTGADSWFEPIETLDELKKLFREGGRGSLENDIVADEDLTVQADVWLCLHNKVLNLNQKGHIIVTSSVSFELIDCSDLEPTTRYYNKDDTGLWTLKASGESDYFTTGGVITGGKEINGGGIYNRGTVNMYGGNIAGNTVRSDTYTPLGGGVYNSGTFTVKNGHIDGNTAYSNYRALGGGLYANGNVGTDNGQTGETIVENGTISNNKVIGATDALGAGVYVAGNKRNNSEQRYKYILACILRLYRPYKRNNSKQCYWYRRLCVLRLYRTYKYNNSR